MMTMLMPDSASMSGKTSSAICLTGARFGRTRSQRAAAMVGRCRGRKGRCLDLTLITCVGNLDGRVNALYSTPSIYTDAKYAANESWPLKTDDFFPYADSANAYWTGYFTSRAAIKGYVRAMSAYYLAARQLEFLKNTNSSGPKTDTLVDALCNITMELVEQKSSMWLMIMQRECL